MIQSELKSGRLHAFLDEQEVQERLSALYRWAKISLEENGANTLYLALGFLKWYEKMCIRDSLGTGGVTYVCVYERRFPGKNEASPQF